MEDLFDGKTDEELKIVYEEILRAREDGLRPRILDSYIEEVRSVHPLSVAEGWKFTEQLFWEEVAKRYFKTKEKGNYE